MEDKAVDVDLDEVHAQYTITKDILASAGYEVRHGKNTFSKVD